MVLGKTIQPAENDRDFSRQLTDEDIRAAINSASTFRPPKIVPSPKDVVVRNRQARQITEQQPSTPRLEPIRVPQPPSPVVPIAPPEPVPDFKANREILESTVPKPKPAPKAAADGKPAAPPPPPDPKEFLAGLVREQELERIHGRMTGRTGEKVDNEQFDLDLGDMMVGPGYSMLSPQRQMKALESHNGGDGQGPHERLVAGQMMRNITSRHGVESSEVVGQRRAERLGTISNKQPIAALPDFDKPGPISKAISKAITRALGRMIESAGGLMKTGEARAKKAGKELATEKSLLEVAIDPTPLFSIPQVAENVLADLTGRAPKDLGKSLMRMGKTIALGAPPSAKTQAAEKQSLDTGNPLYTITDPSWIVERGVEILPLMALQISAAMATRGRSAKAFAFGGPAALQEAGAGYQQIHEAVMEQTGDEDLAHTAGANGAIMVGIGSAFLDRIGTGRILFGRVPGTADVFASSLARRFVKRAVAAGVTANTEGVTELAQEAWQDAVQFATTKDPEAFKDWQVRYPQAGVLGTLAGASADIAVGGSQAPPAESQTEEVGPLYRSDLAAYEQTQPGEQVRGGQFTEEVEVASRALAETLNDGDVLVEATGRRWVVESGLLLPLDESGRPLGEGAQGLRKGRHRTFDPSRGALNVVARSRIERAPQESPKPAPAPPPAEPAPPTAVSPRKGFSIEQSPDGVMTVTETDAGRVVGTTTFEGPTAKEAAEKFIANRESEALASAARREPPKQSEGPAASAEAEAAPGGTDPDVVEANEGNLRGTAFAIVSGAIKTPNGEFELEHLIGLLRHKPEAAIRFLGTRDWNLFVPDFMLNAAQARSNPEAWAKRLEDQLKKTLSEREPDDAPPPIQAPKLTPERAQELAVKAIEDTGVVLTPGSDVDKATKAVSDAIMAELDAAKTAEAAETAPSGPIPYKYTPIDASQASGKTFYHGTKAGISSINDIDPEQFASVRGLYGIGVYLTDNPNVGRSYAKRKGKGPTGVVLAAKLKDVSLVNLDEHLAPAVADVFRNIAVGGLDESISDPAGKTGTEVFEDLKSLMEDEEITSSEAIEIYQNLTESLSTIGFDGLLHRGGQITKEAPHNVVILFPVFDPQGRPLQDKLEAVGADEGGERSDTGPVDQIDVKAAPLKPIVTEPPKEPTSATPEEPKAPAKGPVEGPIDDGPPDRNRLWVHTQQSGLPTRVPQWVPATEAKVATKDRPAFSDADILIAHRQWMRANEGKTLPAADQKVVDDAMKRREAHAKEADPVSTDTEKIWLFPPPPGGGEADTRAKQGEILKRWKEGKEPKRPTYKIGVDEHGKPVTFPPAPSLKFKTEGQWQKVKRQLAEVEAQLGEGGLKPGKQRQLENRAAALRHKINMRGLTTGVPAAKKPVDVIKELAIVAGTIPSHYGMNAVKVEADGQRAVATDGRVVLHLIENEGGKFAEDGFYNAKGAKVDVEGQFPPYQDVMESARKTQEKVGDIADLDVFRRNALRAGVMSSPDSAGTAVYKNPEGSIGLASASEFGVAELNVQKGAEMVIGADSNKLNQAAQFFMRGGATTAEFSIFKTNKGVPQGVIMEAQSPQFGKMTAIVMGMKRPEAPAKPDAAPDDTGVPGEGPDQTFEGSEGFPVTAKFQPSTSFSATSSGKAAMARRSDIMRILDATLGPVRVGRFRGAKKFLGKFFTPSHVSRIASANHVEVAAHEVGHHIRVLMVGPGKQGAAKLAPWANELHPLGVRIDPKNALPEGVAEFVRLTVMDPARASAAAPRFAKAFEAFVKTMPEVENGLVAAQKLWSDYVSMPDVAKVNSVIRRSEEGRRRVTFKQVIRGFYANFIDDQFHLHRVLKEAAADHPTFEAAATAATNAAWTMRGEVGRVDAMLRHQVFDYEMQEVAGVKPLLDTLTPLFEEGSIDQFDAYLVARRENELRAKRGPNGGGLHEDVDTKKAQADLEKEYPHFKQAAEDVTLFTRAVRDYFKASGFLTDDAAAAMDKMNEQYVPFQRWFDPNDLLPERRTSKRGATTEGFVDQGKGIHRFRSSKRDIISPIESVFRNTEILMTMADRNRVGGFLMELANVKGAGKWVEVLPQQRPIKPINMQVRELKSSLEDLGVEVDDAVLGEIVTIFRPGMLYPKPDEHIAAVWQKGKTVNIQLDPNLYQAVKALDAHTANWLVKLLSVPAKTLRIGATSTPEFALTNLLRDQPSAAIFTNFGYNPFLDLPRGVHSLVAKDSDYVDWLKGGGAQSMFVSQDLEEMRFELKQLLALRRKGLKRIPGLLKFAGRHPIQSLRKFGEVTEIGTRLGGFKKAVGERPRTRENLESAARESRDMTLDFSRMGRYGRLMNMITAFWNPAMQEPDRIVRAFKKNPKGFVIRGLVFLTIPALIQEYMFYGDDEYEDIPEWQKQLFYIAKLPGVGFVRIFPKPFLLGTVFANVPRAVMRSSLNAAGGKDSEIGKELGNTLKWAGLPALIPTFALPLVELYANKSMFFDRRIEPLGVTDRQPRDRFTHSTSDMAKRVANMAAPALDALGLGEQGGPMKIEHLVQSWTGGLGRYTMDFGDVALRQFIERPEGAAPLPMAVDYPILRRFLIRNPTSATQSIEDFYDVYSRVNQLTASYNETQDKSRQDTISADPMFQAHTKKSGGKTATGERRRTNTLREAATAIASLRREIRGIAKDTDLDREAKRTQINAKLREMMIEGRKAAAKAKGG